MRYTFVLVLLFAILLPALAEGDEPMQVLQFSSSLRRIETPGATMVTFSVYRDEEGGAPLWTETRTVDVDAAGRFEIVLGEIEKIPLEIFASGEARWLGVQRVPELEQPRILLAAVPYALKARDADTLGGKPLSAFVLAETSDSSPGSDEGDTGAPARGGGMRPLAPPRLPPSGAAGAVLANPISNTAVAYGFELGSISGNTSIGFATTGGEWKTYLAHSVGAGFDSSQLRMRLSDSSLTVNGSLIGSSSNGSLAAVKGTSTAVSGNAMGAFFDGGDTAAYNYGVYANGGDIAMFANATGTSGNTYGVYAMNPDTAATNYGVYAAAGEYGVYAVSTADGTGVVGTGLHGLDGISNAAGSGKGVSGSASSGFGGSWGGYFEGGDTATANYGIEARAGDIGVYGIALGTTGDTRGGEFYAANTAYTNYGVKITAGDFGVWAEVTDATGAILGGTASGGGDLIELSGATISDIEFRVTNAGNVYADGSYLTPAADLAERVDATEAMTAGDVVEIDPGGHRRFRLSTSPRSRRVAGVVSTRPGVVLNDQTIGTAPDETRPALALAGQVPVKVSAENGAIAPGDLLVSSSTPGFAMRADDDPAVGTVIGKALEAFDSGTGVITMLVLSR